MKPLTPVTATAPSSATSITSKTDLLHLLGTSIGGIITNPFSPSATTTTISRGEILTDLTADLTYRLSLPYILPPSTYHPPPPFSKRILWVQGRANIQASHQFYQAAHALGITLVVADVPGHWMEPDDGPHAHFREAFVHLNIDADEGLSQRIIDVVRAYPHPIHGIVSISDARLPHVAKACEVLGLPTESSNAYWIAGNKGETRKLENQFSSGSGGDESIVLETGTEEELNSALAQRPGGEDSLNFSLIVKPCTGWNSDCVVKVSSLASLRAAVRRASARHAASPARNTGVVIEPYVSGPEVDANFIILDGEVLFCDITDDFPCSGDLLQNSKAANFMETLMDVPSALPEDEQKMMRDSLTESIKRCGFRSGIFHCEARVRNSTAFYAPREDNPGILDLHFSSPQKEEEATPSCYLHEVNARSPGYINCVAALLAHGVDYYAVRLLLALGAAENPRIKALSTQFRTQKPQYTLGIAVLPPTRTGTMGSEDAVGEFLDANPDLNKHVVFYQTVKEKGETVQGPDSSELWCVGYVIVASRKRGAEEARKECLELAQACRERFDYRLLEDD